MASIEGVIKFQLKYEAAPPLPGELLREISAWRTLMYQTQLIGQDPGRYGGFGFGNISMRLTPYYAPAERRRFVISGTQTGGLVELTPEQYATVLEFHPAENLVVAEGPVRPSAESLTHGAVYAVDPELRWVLHAHSPHIWRHAAALEIPITGESVAYGTPQMAEEVARLFQETHVEARRLFSMGGHEDGIVAFGRTAEEAGQALLTALARAYQLD